MTMTAQKTAMALATGLLLTTSAFAQTAPDFTVYGRLDLGIENYNNGGFNRTMIQNYGSRFGVKGAREFSKDLSGIFQVETGIAPDDTTQSKSFASRNSFVGLKSNSMGTFLVGTYDTPLKMLDAGGYAGTLYGEGEAMEVVIHGKGTATVVPAAPNANFTNVHTRQSNNLVYLSPKFENFVAKVSYSPDEQTATIDAAKSPVTANTNQGLYSASLEWNNGTMNAGVATQTKLISDQPFAMTATKLTFGAKVGAFSGAIVVSSLDNQAPLTANVRKTSNALVVLNYVDGPLTYKFNTGFSGESAANAQDDFQMYALEAAYALDKNTTVYGGLAQILTNAKSKATIVAADNAPGLSAAGADPTAVTFGIRYNF